MPFKKGHKPVFTKKHRDNLSKANKIAQKKKWENAEYRKMMSDSHKGKTGKESSNWQGGVSETSYPIDWTETLRRSIRERDKYTCKLCSSQQGDRAFSVHHIDYDKDNCNPINLITLCVYCHGKTNNNREYWTEYFTNQYNNNMPAKIKTLPAKRVYKKKVGNVLITNKRKK